MKEFSDELAVILGEYIVNTGATVRAAPMVFKVGKYTVYTEVTKRNGLCGC